MLYVNCEVLQVSIIGSLLFTIRINVLAVLVTYRTTGQLKRRAQLTYLVLAVVHINDGRPEGVVQYCNM